MALRRRPRLTRAQVWSVTGFSAAMACGTTAFAVLQGNILAIFLKRIEFSSVLIGTLFLVIQLMSLIQVWGARYVDRHGCKRLLMLFWAVAPLGALPLILYPHVLGGVGKSWAVVGVFIGAGAYAFANFIAGSGWIPIMRQNLPQERAAELVGLTNGVSLFLACCATFGLSFLFGKKTPIGSFQVLFVVAAFAAALRALFVSRVRDAEPAPVAAPEKLAYDLRRIWQHLDFRRVIIFIAVSHFAIGITIPFRSPYIMDLGFSDRFAAVATVTVILGMYGLAAWGWGRLADRYGSRGAYILGGTGAVLGNLLMLLPWDSGYLSGLVILLALGASAASWGGIDAGNIRRLFIIVPRKNQSLYMVIYLIGMNVSLAVGSFVGGVLLKVFEHILPGVLGKDSLPPAVEYRALFVVAATLITLSILYARRMRRLKEVSTPRLLLHLRLRTQRRLTTGFLGAFLRFRVGKPNK